MGQRNHHHQNNRPKKRATAHREAIVREPIVVAEKKPQVKYGKPFILLEDSQKATFIYQGGQWTRHALSIAECRLDCQVKALPQKINGMTRYEICSPLQTSQ